jgi:hypothetical protein
MLELMDEAIAVGREQFGLGSGTLWIESHVVGPNVQVARALRTLSATPLQFDAQVAE